jgi:hypothetical protein
MRAVSENDDLGQKLDLLIALTRMGVREQLDRDRKAIEGEPVSLALLQQADDWVAAGQLKATVRDLTKQSGRTVERRIAELISRGAMQRRGSGGSISYRSTGLFEV